MNKIPDKMLIPIHSVDFAERIDQVPFFSKPNNIFAQVQGLEKQVDLAYGRALYLAEGGNNNGYYFSRHLILANYKSAIMKPINIGHNQDFIVGIIYDVALSKRKDENDPEPKLSYIDDSKIKFDDKESRYIVEGYNGPLDMWINFALFRAIYPGVVDTIQENVSGNMNADSYFISMEIYFDEYKYLWNEDESTLFDKTVGNSYLDSYVGKTMEGKKLYKMYTGPVSFGGGGIVGDPAEPRAVLSDVAKRDVAHSTLSVKRDGDVYKIGPLSEGSDQDKVKGEQSPQKSIKEDHDMDLDISKIVQQVESSVLDRVKQLQAEKNLDEATAKIQAQGEQLGSLSKKLEDVSAASDEAVDKAQSALDEANEKLDAATKRIEELDGKVKDLESSQLSDEDKSDLAEHRKAKLVTTRLEDLASKGVTIPKAKKEEVTEKLESFTDDQYNAYASALEMAGLKAEDKKETKGEEGKEEGDTEAGAGSEAGSEENKNADKDTSAAVDDQTADKILSGASKKPDVKKDKASTDKRTNRFKALSSLTFRTKESVRGK